jgi:hypothetical protein
VSGYRQRVVDLTEPIRQQLGLKQALSMRIRIDQQSGRMPIPGITSREGLGLGDTAPSTNLPVEVVVAASGPKAPGTFASAAALGRLAELFYLRGRRFLVLRRAPGPHPDSFSIQVDLPALPGAPATGRHMHEVPGVLDLFSQLWREFGADCRFQRRFSIIQDRRDGKVRSVLETGGSPRVEGNFVVHSVGACLKPEDALGLHETVLGAVHTHLRGIAPSLAVQRHRRPD